MLRELLIVRHGSSIQNELMVPFDMPDCQVPLSDCGRMQSAILGKTIRDFIGGKCVDERSVSIWASPYVRAWETCDHIMNSLHNFVTRVERDVRLSEWHMCGGCKRLPRNLLANDSKFRNGESWSDLCGRTKNSLVHMTEEYNLCHGPSNIIIVSHVGPILSAVHMLHKYSGMEGAPEHPPLNASVRRFKISESGKVLDMGYLFKGFMPGRLR